MAKPIYLDFAAATPLDGRVLESMQSFLTEKFYNPSATYLAAKEVQQALAAARSKVGHWLGARPSEIIFTAGGTEANNLAIHGIMRQFPEGNIVISGMEHESVLAPAHEYDCREVRLQLDGRVDLEDLRRKIDGNTVLVSVMYANNEIGTIEPIREIAKLVEEVRKSRKGRPLYFHTDAAQAANYLDLHVARLGVDIMTLNGGKLYGPKQSGALYVKAGLQLKPLVQGGGQERGLRSGTENVAGAIGLAEALDIAQTMRGNETARLQRLQRLFLELVGAKLPAARVNGSLKHRLPNNVHVTLPGKDNERLLIQLDEAGIQAAAGSACSASDEEPSHVLRAIGLSESDARASLRFTMGRTTTEADVKRTAEVLSELA
ncbi:MAG TPA: cysteine desulfurase family protein [Candidatus Saccharimonadia bacterium]|nr:cysteine desulfurase family protein [Candidatus Saccharimonadia bacterium]